MESGKFQASAGRALERVIDQLAAGVPPDQVRATQVFDWASVDYLVEFYAERRGVDAELVFRVLGVQRPKP